MTGAIVLCLFRRNYKENVTTENRISFWRPKLFWLITCILNSLHLTLETV